MSLTDHWFNFDCMLGAREEAFKNLMPRQHQAGVRVAGSEGAWEAEPLVRIKWPTLGALALH